MGTPEGEAGTLGDMESSRMNETGRKAPTMLARLWIDNGGEAVQHEAERLTAEAGRIPEGKEQQARKLADDLRDLAEGAGAGLGRVSFG